MTEPRSYLDHNATSPLRPEVLDGMAAALGLSGNPSSIHREGRTARSSVERAREQVALLVDADPADVVFTSGGTEANNMALRPGALLDRRGDPVGRLVTPEIEHASVLYGHGFPAECTTILPVDETGRVEQRSFATALDFAGPGSLVSIAVANSETGTVQPIAELARLASEIGAAVHADAVQAAGRLPLGLRSLGVDALTLSAHKLGGPTGIGALVAASARRGPAFRFMAGGGQEGRARAGTENVAGIVGFGIAAEQARLDLDRDMVRLASLRDAAEAAVRSVAPRTVVFGAGVERLPNTLCFAVPGLSAETALIALDLDGVAVSSGSACSSGKVGHSHVLAAMGVGDDLARGALRLSFGWNSSHDDVRRFGRAFEKMVQRLYNRGRARAA